MEWYLISGYAAVCIAFFAILRIPLNRWTVPTASISGIVLTFALVQLLNYYHPYSNMSRQYLTTAPNTSGEIVQATGLPAEGGEHTLIAWFNQNSLSRLKDGSTAEVTFDSLPGKVFTAKTRMVLPMLDEDQVWAQNKYLAPSAGAQQSRVPVLISIRRFPRTDRHLRRTVAPTGVGTQDPVAHDGLDELPVPLLLDRLCRKIEKVTQGISIIPSAVFIFKPGYARRIVVKTRL
jgi:hypothetical protein